jgi:hypothetical protein
MGEKDEIAVAGIVETAAAGRDVIGAVVGRARAAVVIRNPSPR